MKIPCELVRDLLPLYHDGVCSNVSKAFVAEHLNSCDACTKTLETIDTEMTILKPDSSEAKPLQALRRKWKKKTWLIGAALGVALFLVAFSLWFSLTQSSSVPIAMEDYSIDTLVQFSNGMVYLEYSHPYKAMSYGADIHRTEEGALHLIEYRPRVIFPQGEENRVTKRYLIDPTHDTFYADASGKEVPFTAFYLGCPEAGDALLVWSTDMELPLATPDMEQEYLYQRISNW